MNRRFCCLFVAIVLAILSVGQTFPARAYSAEIPSASIKIPPLVKEESISTYVPSDAAPGQGLAVNLIYSSRPRYKEGAPVVVVIPGGHGSQGLDFSMHSAQQGFIEVRFAFPGGGKPGFSSSGIFDNRGVKSQEAVRDVLRFAAGEIPDHQGKFISDILPHKVMNKTVGAVGWSNGGNILLVSMSKFAEQLPFVAWLAFYESPAGSMFYPPALGGAQDFLVNKHYRQGTAATGQVLVDFRKLRYQQDAMKSPGAHKKTDEPALRGVAYFDENQNGIWEEAHEFAIPYSTDIGVEKQIYAPPVTKALIQLPEFQPPKNLPKPKDKKKEKPIPLPFASYEESLAYFSERDGSLHIKDVIRQHPDLAITVFGSHLDHLQRQSDHPHIAMLYNTILENKPKFVRLNPSSVYVGIVSYMKPSTFAENKPNFSIDADTIDQHLEPEGLLPDYVYMDAAIAELADRFYTSKWAKILEAPLVNYANGAKPPEELGKGKSSTTETNSHKDEPGAVSPGSQKDVSLTKEETPTKEGAGAPSKESTAKKGKPANSGKTAPGSSTAKDWPFKGNR